MTINTGISVNPTIVNGKVEASRPWRWLWRILLGLLIFVFLLAVTGAIYQAIATSVDLHRFLPPGQLVDIGAPEQPLRLHLNCVGDGSPTVILESGQGGHSSNWAWIQPQVAEHTRVCAYDRAGVGWSDPGPAPRDARQITEELHALLTNAKIPGPYLLVGHSYGGLYARVYAGTYPAEVSGVVLIDASHPEQWVRLPGGETQFNRTQQIYVAARILTRLGILRLIGYNPVNPEMPPQAAAEFKAMLDTTRFVDAAADEFAASSATSDQVIAAGNLGDKPLYVLTATEHGAPAEVEQLARELQVELVGLSSNSVQQVVEGANHASLLIKQDDARITAAAIVAVVEAVRTGQPLGQY